MRKSGTAESSIPSLYQLNAGSSMKLTTLAESYLARLASLSSRLVVGPPRPIVMAQKAGKCKNYDEGSASAHAFMPASLDEQSPKAARIASSQSATIRSRSIPGGGRMGVNGSPAHVSNSGGGLVATAITFGPQPARARTATAAVAIVADSGVARGMAMNLSSVWALS